MRHLRAGRKLGRNASHRLALKRNLARALFEHERIITTVEKAKEVRSFVEKLITLAKKGTRSFGPWALLHLVKPRPVSRWGRVYRGRPSRLPFPHFVLEIRKSASR